jgi:(5-formylfuran-3-yl)methyl phosphate synthase
MTGLLVSTRNARETRLALAGGADLIDVKEPARGALGAADPAVWAEVLGVTAGAVPASAALGEMIAAVASPHFADLANFQFAKWGLAHCQRYPDWRERWTQRLGWLPSGVVPVAVAYADWQQAEAPRPDDVIEDAARLRCGVVLFDTYDKTRGGLLDHLPVPQLARLTNQSRQAGLRVVLGGSLCRATISRVLPLEPDYVAVRGAVCRHGRTGDLDVVRVRELRALLQSVA